VFLFEPSREEKLQKLMEKGRRRQSLEKGLVRLKNSKESKAKNARTKSVKCKVHKT